MARISEDIRFYLPSDPYYFKVDNLPLQDLLKNDKRLQTQIDELQQASVGVTVNRNGVLELQPYIDNAIPGTISVRPGSFIGRVQRSSAGDGVPASVLNGVDNGTREMNTPPTIRGGVTDPGHYSTDNPPNNIDEDGKKNPAASVGRLSLINFPGGTISIDGWSNDGFEEHFPGDNEPITDPPRARIDVVGITTVNGALDDPFIPGNAEELDVAIGNGQAQLAVVKGAGLINSSPNREVGITVGERFHTIGQPTETMNGTTKLPDGTLSTDKRIGTYPLSDDVVNICFSREDIRDSLEEWAQSQRNASFFLPIAYVYVGDNHGANNPIPQSWLYDIRPFFRTAELTLAERQSLAASVNPSVTNPVVTASYQETRLGEEVDRANGLASIQQQLNTLRAQLIDAFASLDASKITTTSSKTVNSSIGNTTWTSFRPALDAGYPENATHVILYAGIVGDGPNQTATDPHLWVRGRDGDWVVAKARGADEAGPESEDTNSSIIALIDADGTGGGYFRYKNSTSASTERGYMYLRGYITPQNVTISLPPPSDATE